MKDFLAWELFNKKFNDNTLSKECETVPDNRLIAESPHFFAIAGWGAFVPGYVLVVTKEPIPSMGALKREHRVELIGFVSSLAADLKAKFNMPVAYFEQGHCEYLARERAHLHLMCFPIHPGKLAFENSINKTLKMRAAGLTEYNYYGQPVFEETAAPSPNKSQSNLLRLDSFNRCSDIEHFFLMAEESYIKGSSYVFFRSEETGISFFTEHKLGSQFCQHFIFNYCLSADENLAENQKLNAQRLLWRWQDEGFFENVQRTLDAFQTTYQ